jgi:iron(III) transport system substrate-binding protein
VSRCFRLSPPLVLLLLGVACAPSGPVLPPEESVKVPGDGSVVVYVEAPRYLVGPILKTFSEQSGVTVRATYREQAAGEFLDTVRTEAAAGRADLFVGVSSLSAVALARAGLAVPFRPLGARPVPTQYRDPGYRWIGFAVNPRVIIYNHDQMSKEEAPQSIDDLTEGRWAGKGVLAGLASGTPAYQAAALFARWGDAMARDRFDAILKAGNRIVGSDEEVRRLVTEGEVPWGVIDLDRAICSKRQADPINISFPDRLGIGAVMVPETVVLLKGAPNPAQARGLFAYMFATETAWQVGQNDCALMSLLPVVAMGIPKPDWVPVLGAVNILSVDNEAVYDAWVRNQAYLSAWGRTAAAR